MVLRAVTAVALLSGGALVVATMAALQPVPSDLATFTGDVERQRFIDRHGELLNITYHNQWNIHDRVALHELPLVLQQALISAEDKRFFEHHGIDWKARLSALWQNLVAAGRVRGASTISEQVVKMLHPRPRTVWSRWLEGFEAQRLEAHNSKLAILEFYLNQVPYAAQRRGVKQAASYYFDRDLETLNLREMLALAVMIRAPRWFDPQQQPDNLRRAVDELATRMGSNGLLSPAQLDALAAQQIEPQHPQLSIHAAHFLAYVKSRAELRHEVAQITTTLDAGLQRRVQGLLDSRLRVMRHSAVGNGAALVVDHQSGEILAWVVGHATSEGAAFNQIDPLLVPRQPGSTLKPLLYALTLERGWSAATLLADTPLDEGVGSGMHSYHNYSRNYYGNITLREALGNSLNIPAVRTIQFVGVAEFLSFLQQCGINSLDQHPNLYGDGIALGNGEVTLLELVQAYSTLARMGDYKQLTAIEGGSAYSNSYRVLSADSASLIADILSDSAAREKEFGSDSILNLPQQTAVKTGTSSDYRDAWAIGYNDRYTVGIWFGNLDYQPMHEVTGSTGPAVVLRSVFNELNRGRAVKALYLSPNLIRRTICSDTGRIAEADADCRLRDELFVAGEAPAAPATGTPTGTERNAIALRRPTHNLQLAMDPRIPDEYEFFELEINPVEELEQVEWYINGKLAATTTTPNWRWQLARGEFVAQARVFLHGNKHFDTAERHYRVQ